jgi:hypothetical protein
VCNRCYRQDTCVTVGTDKLSTYLPLAFEHLLPSSKVNVRNESFSLVCSQLQYCQPNVLLSSVQCLTDVPCCAAGSRKHQNLSSEEHLDAQTATVCVAEMWSAVNIQWGKMTTLIHRGSQRWRGNLQYDLLCRSHVLAFISDLECLTLP